MAEAVARPTIAVALAEAATRLAAAGCDTPRLDAEVLLAFVLGVERARLVLDRLEPVGPAAAVFEALVARREAREPVAYLTGRRDFRWLTLAVDRRVLIPRPETELLVEVGLSLAPGARVLDVGTGSGAVALALASERPDLRVRGTDVSAGALEVARANAAALALDVEFAEADLLDGEAADAVLANLPYVPDGTPLAPELAFEPAGALFAGADGLDAVRRLISRLADRPAVRRGAIGLVGLEIGPEQAGEVSELVRGAGFADVSVLSDLAGHERVVVGRR